MTWEPKTWWSRLSGVLPARLGTSAGLLAALLLGAWLGMWIAVPPDAGDGASSGSGSAEEAGGESGQTWTCSMHPQVQKDHPGDCPVCGMELVPADEGEGGDGDGTAEEGGGPTWTCSMHPQVQKDEPGQCPECGMDLVPADEGGDGDGDSDGSDGGGSGHGGHEHAGAEGETWTCPMHPDVEADQPGECPECGMDLVQDDDGGADGDGQTWTCPMHPDVEENEPGQCPECGMDLVEADEDADGDGAKQAASEEGSKTWTCSMHPQVRKDEPGDCPICGMELVPVSSLSGGETGGGRPEGEEDTPRVKLSKQARTLAEIETTEVRRQTVDKHLRLVGKVAYDETRLARITARFGGRIEKMYVDYTGTRVEKGDHLFDLYSPELLVAQRELLEAHRRVERLEQRGSDRALESARATEEAAREKLRLWELRPWQIDRIVEREEPRETVTVYAPMGGIVTEKAQLTGSYVDTGTEVYTIADLSHVWVVLDAFESQIQWIHYGQPVHFEVDAYPGRMFEGEVSFVSPSMDPKTRTVHVRVNVPNPERTLKPGMYLRARIHARLGGEGADPLSDVAGKYMCPMHPEVVSDEPSDCTVCGMDLVPAEEHWLVSQAQDRVAEGMETPLVIPHTAPLLTGERAIVFVEVPDASEPTYALREIRLGPRAGDHYVVRAGLRAGERIVSHGAFKLDSALQIRGDRSAMSYDPDQTEGDGSDAEGSSERHDPDDHDQGGAHEHGGHEDGPGGAPADAEDGAESPDDQGGAE